MYLKSFKELRVWHRLIITKDLYHKFDYQKAESLLEEVQKMLNVIIKKLENKY
jgi:four helix bundle protein